MRENILMILLGIFIGFTVSNGYFVLSGSYPSSPLEAIPYNFTTGSIATALGFIAACALIVYLKKKIESLNLKYVSMVLVGFFLFALLTFVKNGVYPAAIVCLVLTFIFAYIGFFRKKS